MNFVISAEKLQAIVDYLKKCPYEEVSHLIASFASLPQFVEHVVKSDDAPKEEVKKN